MALQPIPCAVTTLTAQKLSGAVSAYVDMGFQDGYPGKNHIITVIYHNTPQTSPTCPPISPKTQAKSWQAASPARQKVIFPANCHTCSNISFLRLAEGCSFHPVQNRISTTWLRAAALCSEYSWCCLIILKYLILVYVIKSIKSHLFSIKMLSGFTDQFLSFCTSPTNNKWNCKFWLGVFWQNITPETLLVSLNCFWLWCVILNSKWHTNRILKNNKGFFLLWETLWVSTLFGRLLLLNFHKILPVRHHLERKSFRKPKLCKQQ